MGIIKTIKSAIKFRKMMKESAAQWIQQLNAYRSMANDEFAALPDEELFPAAVCRTEAIVDSFDDISAGFSALNSCQKVLYAVNYLEIEVNNGGLCQFFVNSSRAVAPYISKYLDVIGATEHKELFDRFISRCGIDLSDLSSFQISRISDFEKQTKRYPFDEYDDAFYGLPSLQDPLTAYIRENVNEF